MNKFSFVKQLLENEKFSTSQKERFIKLVSNELESAQSIDDQVLEDIRLIKEKIGFEKPKSLKGSTRIDVEAFMSVINDDGELIEESNDNEELTKEKNTHISTEKVGVGNLDEIELQAGVSQFETGELPFIHQPKKLVEFLNKFTQNGSALKYATHSWTMGKSENIFKNIEDFLAKIDKEFKSFSWDLKLLKKELSSKIYAFLLNKNVEKEGWGTYRIKFGWSSAYLAEVLKKDLDLEPSKVILPMEIRTTIKVLNKKETIQNFGHVIKLFKDEIEVREDGNNLEKLVVDSHRNNLPGDFIIKELRDLKGAVFYTDVDYFKKALERIMEGIKTRTQYPDISYVAEDKGDYYLFQIIHHESNAIGKSIEDNKFKLTGGDFGSLKFLLENLCDWSIVTEFKEGLYRLNFLVSDKEIPKIEKVEGPSLGFIHEFKFYKP